MSRIGGEIACAMRPGVEALRQTLAVIRGFILQLSAVVDRFDRDGVDVTNTHAVGVDVPDTTFHIEIGKPKDLDA